MLTELAEMHWRDAVIRIAQTLAVSIILSAAIALVFKRDSFAESMFASFIIFHGAVSPLVLATPLDVQATAGRYIVSILLNFLFFLFPVTILYKTLYGPLLIFGYDYFAGIILYGLMTGAATISYFSKRMR